MREVAPSLPNLTVTRAEGLSQTSLNTLHPIENDRGGLVQHTYA